VSVTPERVTAVVLNWRTPELTERAVRALVGDGLPESRIVVVDNGSGGEDADRLAAALPGSLLLPLRENVGFARGNNAGAARLPGDAYLFVNSDAFVHRDGSVARMADLLERAAIVVPRLLNEDLTLQPNVVPPTTTAVELVRASGLSRFLPDRARPGWSTHWGHGDRREIAAAIGAVVLVRRDAWEDLAGFDERRFMYAEDLDLFWRARRHGWPIWFEPTAEFVHLGGASAARRWGSAERAAQVAAAEAEMVRAHMPPLHALATLAVIAAGAGARALARGVQGNREAARELATLAVSYLRPPRRT
jgi:GT2 family glycosyltransferase